MYNRYIPQPDGSFHRRQVPDPSVPKKGSPLPCPPAKPEPSAREKQPRNFPSAQCRNCPVYRKSTQQEPEPKASGIGALLHQILPKDFDSGDLMVILLLLLMSSEQSEDQTTALLTLALYLFL